MRAILVVALLSSAAHASPANEITFGSSVRALRSSSADALTADGLAGGALRVGHALDLPIAIPLHGDFALWLQGGLDWGTAHGALFHTLASDVAGIAITGGAQLRYQPIHYVAASAQLAIGTERASVTLTDMASHTASDSGWSGVARGALQIDVLAVDMSRFALGMRLELGYLATSGVGLVPVRAQDDTLKIPMTEASIGHLDLSGPYFNASVVTQF